MSTTSFKDARLTRWVLPLLILASALGGCKNDNVNRVVKLEGKDLPNTELCTDPAAPYGIRTKQGLQGAIIVCVSEETFNKYKVGDPYP